MQLIIYILDCFLACFLPSSLLYCLHQRTVLHAVEGSREVSVQHSVPSLGPYLLRWTEELAPSIVHQVVYLPMLPHRAGHETLHLTRSHDQPQVIGTGHMTNHKS